MLDNSVVACKLRQVEKTLNRKQYFIVDPIRAACLRLNENCLQAPVKYIEKKSKHRTRTCSTMKHCLN
jgi:hypothetical protein